MSNNKERIEYYNQRIKEFEALKLKASRPDRIEAVINIYKEELRALEPNKLTNYVR